MNLFIYETPEELAEAAARELLALDEPPTALFTAQNLITVGAVHKLRELDLHRTVALVGFDDLEQASWPVFGLTTIKVPFDDMMRSAVAMLVERLGGYRGAHRQTVHSIKPVLRRTHLTGPGATGRTRTSTRS